MIKRCLLVVLVAWPLASNGATVTPADKTSEQSVPGKVEAAKPTETVDEASRRVLTTKDFPFCSDSENAMPPWHKEWCDVSEQATTCPQLKAMCARKWDGDSRWSWLTGRKKGKVGEDSAGGMFDRFELPSFSLPGAQVFFWILIGTLIAIVLALIVRAVLNRQQPLTDPQEDEVVVPGLEFEDPGLGEVAKLLAQARAEVDRDVGRALMLLYAAILRHLEDKGFIHWDIATTNREYVRTVRGKTPLDRPMAELVREVERVKFGRVPPGRETFDTLYDRIARQLGIAAVLLIVTVFGAGCSSCEFGDPGLDGHAAFVEILKTQGITSARLAAPLDRLSGKDSPVILDMAEFSFDRESLQAIERAVLAGAPIMLLMDTTKRLSSWPSVAVVNGAADLPEAAMVDEDDEEEDGGRPHRHAPPANDSAAGSCSVSDADAGAGATDADGGATDFSAESSEAAAGSGPEADGGSASAADGGDPFYVLSPQYGPFDTDPATPRTNRSVLGPPLRPTPTWSQAADLTSDSVGYLPAELRLALREMDHDKPEILVERGGKPFAVRWQTEDGLLLAVADRRMISNAAMSVPTNARLAVALTRELVGAKHEVSFGALAVSSAAQTPAASLLNAGLLAMMLQGLLVLAIFFASRGLAFGALRDRSQTGRRAFSEHVTALGHQFMKSRGSRFTASLYATYALDRFWLRTGREVDRQDMGALARVVAVRVGRPEDEVRATLEAADALRRTPSGLAAPESDLSLVRKLGEYLAALQRE